METLLPDMIPQRMKHRPEMLPLTSVEYYSKYFLWHKKRFLDLKDTKCFILCTEIFTDMQHQLCLCFKNTGI